MGLPKELILSKMLIVIRLGLLGCTLSKKGLICLFIFLKEAKQR